MSVKRYRPSSAAMRQWQPETEASSRQMGLDGSAPMVNGAATGNSILPSGPFRAESFGCTGRARQTQFLRRPTYTKQMADSSSKLPHHRRNALSERIEGLSVWLVREEGPSFHVLSFSSMQIMSIMFRHLQPRGATRTRRRRALDVNPTLNQEPDPTLPGEAKAPCRGSLFPNPARV